MGKKEREEIISKEQIEDINETIDKAAEACSTKEEEQKIDFEKVKDTLRSLEGVNVHTVMSILTTAMLLLPAGAILTVNKMGGQAFKAKAFSEILKKAEDGGIAELIGLGKEEE